MDINVTDDALELLESLEQQHRHDLTLHLYSCYLLKQLLRRAHRRKRALETEVYIKTMIKDNWTSWPSPNTVIDPHIDELYEDYNIAGGSNSSMELGSNDLDYIVPAKGEISAMALKHATRMMQLEMNAVWQKNLMKSESLISGHPGVTLDIDKMNMPTDIMQNVLMKLDTFLEGLNTNCAKQTKLELSTQPSSSRLVFEPNGLSGGRNSVDCEHVDTATSTDMNKKVRFDYRDIIVRGCEMQQDISNVYIKCLELFEETTTQYNTKQFKISKNVLQKYMPKQQYKVAEKPTKELQKDYWELDALTRDRNIGVETRKALRLMKLKNGFSKDKKTFMMVQQASSVNTRKRDYLTSKESSDDESEDELDADMVSKRINSTTGEDEDAYCLSDCLIR